jgi:ribosomal protein L16 Arg81 hydroxylase
MASHVSVERPRPARRDAITFAQVTAPIDPGQFLSTYWSQQAVLLREDGRTFEKECGWDAVNAILNARDLVFPKIKLSRNEQVVSTDAFTIDVGGQRIVDGRAVLNLFQEGASFGITGADSYWPPLRSVVECVYDALLESVHANVYCSPPNTQGFQCHFDLHEVFVLQVGGTKRWRVFRPRVDASIEGWRTEDARLVLSTEPYLDVVLHQGDVLYVPRGHWHYAVAQDSISLHVTIGVTCRKGTTFLDWLAADLSREAVWRHNAPLLGIASEDGTGGTAGVTRWAEELKQSLNAKISETDLFQRFCSDTLTAIRPAHTVQMPFQVMTDHLALEQFVFERPSARPYVISQTGASEITISVAGSDIQLEGISASAISRMFASPAFTLADFRAWEPSANIDDVAGLVTELVRMGLLLMYPK